MECNYFLGDIHLKKELKENSGFLLGNKRGSYCCFYESPSSKYHGMFYFDNASMSMYKFIDSIDLVGSNGVSELKNHLFFVERKKNNVTESYMMPSGYNSLIYELNQSANISLVLDCRRPYDNRQWGRNYKIFSQDKCTVIQFTKKTDIREDVSNDMEEFTLYLAVRGDADYYEHTDNWIERRYKSDEERGTNPSSRHVYNALLMQGSKFVFSISTSPDSAIEECNHIFSRTEHIRKTEAEFFLRTLENSGFHEILENHRVPEDTKVAYACAVNSLNNLLVHDENNFGILAGLPWFFQFWARDSMVSLKFISKLDMDMGSRILLKYLNSIGNDGRLPNISTRSGFGTADAHGWMFLRSAELLEYINQHKKFLVHVNRIAKRLEGRVDNFEHYVSDLRERTEKKHMHWHSAIYEMESALGKSLTSLMKIHTSDMMETNSAKETWMDTDFGNDTREGFRIEIQALRLAMYRHMFDLNHNDKYKALENMLRIKVREKFWNGKILADGVGDFTARPNAFIAAYAYPGLLSKEEWSSCFSELLERLWLHWGGLSTIDKSHPLFTDHDLGENTQAYHRGDSWFWINNLASIAMHRINPERFARTIHSILNASTDEILWKGCLGCHSEISDAKDLSSKGCFNQAWSNAMFLEMVDDIFG